MQLDPVKSRNAIIAILLVFFMVMGLGKCSSPSTPPDTRAIGVGETVTQIQALKRLVVFQAYITAVTEAKDDGILFDSKQAMITPAFVNYYIDLSAMDDRSVTIQENTIIVKMPRLMIERPNINVQEVRTYNEGVLTAFSGNMEALRRANNGAVYRRLRAAADQPFLVSAARRQASTIVLQHVQTILAKAGRPDMRVRVSF